MLKSLLYTNKIINPYLLKSIWPIIKAIFKEPFNRRINGNDFFLPVTLLTLTKRINALTPQSQHQWGTMQPAQMLHHLNLATGSAIGFFDLPNESYFLSRTVFKWLTVDFLSEQPKGLLIPLNFKIDTSEHFYFKQEKELLLEILEIACDGRYVKDWGPHPYFGIMNKNEWGRLLTMHIDYHLKQFNV